MSNTVYNEASVLGLAEKLKNSLATLIDLSKRLQQAVIKRDVKTIWALLAEQESKVGELDHYLYLWKELVGGNTGSLPPNVAKAREEVNSRIFSLKVTGAGTSALIKSFLAAIGRAIRTTSSSIARKTSVYGKKGKMQIKQSSLLVNSVG